MGVYYKVACDDLNEQIDPGKINDLGIKRAAIAHPAHPLGSVVIFTLLTRWFGYSARIASDAGDDPGYYDYNDVTEAVLRDYNEIYKTALQFTGSEDEKTP